MAQDEGSETIICKARALERDYDWLGAVEFYRKDLGLVSTADFLKKGQVQERVGYALYRAGMQAESVDKFRERMSRAVAGYERAKELYGKASGQGEKARMIRCDAMIAYVGYWLASEVPEKKRLLGQCWRLAKESLRAFKEDDDALECGLTFNQLSGSVVFDFCFEWDFQVRKKLIREAVEHGEQAINFLSAFEDLSELARAYAKTACFLGVFNYYFSELDERRRGHQKIRNYWQKGVELCEDAALVELIYPIFGLQLLLWEEASDEVFKNLKKALEYGKRMRDRFIIGCALDWLTYHYGWRGWTIENPEERPKFSKTILQYAEDAKQQYAPMSFVSPRADIFWVEMIQAHHYFWLSFDETDLMKKRGLLEKAREAASDGLKRAEFSQYPEVLLYANHLFSNIHAMLANREPNSERKRGLLEEALEYRKEAIRITEQLQPLVAWNVGGMHGNLSAIKHALADFEKDQEIKISKLKDALMEAEKAVKLEKFALEDPSHHKPAMGYFRHLGIGQYQVGVRSNRLYELTSDKEYLRKAAKSLAEAAKSYERVDLKGRIAECHWKVAQMHDALSEHLKAAENFESASEDYMRAAEKIPQLTGFYLDYSSYMRAWAEIERSRHERENENYTKSREHYRACSRSLEKTKKWSYLSPYYFAWSLLDHGEALSRLDKPREAIKSFNEAGRTFEDSANSLRERGGELENSEERDEAFKLANVAGLRKQYCTGRVLMEEATLSDSKGDRASSAEKYACAARIFSEIAPNLEREEAREELRFVAAICEAWEKMELAEERGDAALYREAGKLFAKASEISRRKTAELTAMGNSCFCEALEMGMKFIATSNADFYSGAKLRMESAAGYYQKAGFEKPALWVEATKRLFDAYVYVGKAEAEAEPEKRIRFYLMAEKCLELSAKFFGKAGYRSKKNEVLQNLERVRKQRELAFSLSEVLTAPAVLSSTAGVSMPDLTEKAAGLNGFESANVRASVSVPKEFVPSEEFEVRLDLANVGNRPGLLVRIVGLVPPRCKVLKIPSYCALEDSTLNMKGKRLEPLTVESVSLWVQIAGVAAVSLSPKVVYVDELGNFRTTGVEEAKILPVIEFKSNVAQFVFNFLVNAFVEDCVKRRLGVEKSGWRSFPQIIKGARVSKKSLYGAGGRLGHGLSELQRNGLVDLETLLGERGRGGHILRVRIHYDGELVRRYVREKAPDLLT